MGLILNIESATTVCSVSLSRGSRILAVREKDQGYTHAENLHVFIKEILGEAGVSAHQLDAIALSAGPGSYTGLRIGASTVKGLCYALNKPLISLPTLQIMAAGALLNGASSEFLAPMIDARRMEVYTAVYDRSLREVLPVSALILENGYPSEFQAYGQIAFFGDGMEKCRTILSAHQGNSLIETIRPSAVYMAGLSDQKLLSSQFADIAYFEPMYLKEFIAGKKKKQT